MRAVYIIVICALVSTGIAVKFQRLYSESSSSSSSEQIDNDQLTIDEVFNAKIPFEAEKLSGQELVDYVNKNQNLWKAKLNTKFSTYSDKVKYGLLGVEHVRNSVTARKKLAKSRNVFMNLPESFDARDKWSNCKSLFNIRDQSSCGSCWAFGAVEAMSDRICIASNNRIQVSLSADDLLSCCKSCGFGCHGGDPLSAWRYWVTNGIVTGSNFTEKSGCKPYPFPPCEHHSKKDHFKPCKNDLYPTPKCEKTCQASYTNKLYDEDKFYGRNAYAVENDVESIQNELYLNGPLEIAFEVYDDFLNYESGIYIHQGGKLGGGHAVKLIGWGEENNVPYWIAANSWNTDWGEDGFFRIVRGRDECGIESGVVGGLPDLERTHKELFN